MTAKVRRLLGLIRKEMIEALRDWRTLVLLLTLPLIELVLMAYAVELTVDDLPTGLVSSGTSIEGKAYVDAMTASGYFKIVARLESEKAALRAIDRGEIRAAILIPPDLDRQVARRKGEVLVILDGSDSFTVSSGYNAALAIAQNRALEIVATQASRAGAGQMMQMPINSTTRVLYNPNMDDMVFMLPGLISVLLQMAAVNLTALSVVREYELGTMEQLLVTPLRPLELGLGKMVPSVLITLLSMLIVVVAGIFWFDVSINGSIFLLGWLSLLFIVTALGLGLLISTVARTQGQAVQITALLLLLSMMLTGLIYPRQPMPAVVRWVGDLIPATYFNRIARAIFTKGVGLRFIWRDVAVLAVYAVTVMFGMTRAFQKRLD